MLKIQLADNTQTAKGRQGGAGMSDNAHADRKSHNNITMLMTSDKQQKQQQQHSENNNEATLCQFVNFNWSRYGVHPKMPTFLMRPARTTGGCQHAGHASVVTHNTTAPQHHSHTTTH